MKLIIIIFLIPLSISSQVDSLKGNVKSVREQIIFLEKEAPLQQNKGTIILQTEYGEGLLIPNSRIEMANKIWYRYPSVCYINFYREYDIKKKLISETWFYKDGSRYGKFEYKYDHKNNLIQRRKLYYNSYTDTNFSYSFDNKLTSTIYYDSDNPNNYRYAYYLYNEQGFIKEGKTFDEEGQSSATKVEYDNHGNKTKVIGHSPYVHISNPDGSSKSIKNNAGVDFIKEEYYYDHFGNVREMRKYSLNENKSHLTSTTIYEYDSLKRKVSEAIGKDSIRIIRKFKYSVDNLLLEETHTDLSDSTNNTEFRIFYHNSKHVSKTIYYRNKVETTLDFKYKFDNHNNWIEQIKYVNQKPQLVRKRKIKYY